MFSLFFGILFEINCIDCKNKHTNCKKEVCVEKEDEKKKQHQQYRQQ